MVRFNLFIVICTFISVFMVDLRFQLLQKQQTWQPQKKKGITCTLGERWTKITTFPICIQHPGLHIARFL